MGGARVAIMSSGMRQMSRLLATVADCRIVPWQLGIGAWRCDAIGGWGHKPTADVARKRARRLNVPYIAFEDGWLRSVHSGPEEQPHSLIVDRSGIYYDAGAPSDLERLIAASAANRDPARLERARNGIAMLRSQAISKYNEGPWLSEIELGLERSRGRPRVLVIDQTRGDASVDLGASTPESFHRMLAAALDENPGAEIVVKIHPEVVTGRKQGYLADVDRTRFTVIDTAVNPWALIEAVDKVYVVTSQLGFEALIAGLPVSCFGLPFYAGWGLTDDRVPTERRTARPAIEQLFAAAYFDYAVYVNPRTGDRVTFEETVAALVEERGRALRRHGSPTGSRTLQPEVAEAIASLGQTA